MKDRGVAFRLEGVTVRFGSKTALEGIHLSVEAGEVVGLVGLSGAGKTTLLRLLNGTLRPTLGRVEVNGSSLQRLGGSRLRRVRASIGFIHQDLSLLPNVRVLQNVLAGRLGSLSFWGSLRLFLWPPRPLVEEAYRILERVGIEEKIYERTDRLSGGEQQRVAIARALFQSPRGLLADEPVSSVDPAHARAVVSLLTEIAREKGLTLCASLHNLALAREFFPRLVGLRHGRILFDQPSHAVTAEQLAELYRLNGELAEGEAS